MHCFQPLPDNGVCEQIYESFGCQASQVQFAGPQPTLLTCAARALAPGTTSDYTAIRIEQTTADRHPTPLIRQLRAHARRRKCSTHFHNRTFVGLKNPSLSWVMPSAAREEFRGSDYAGRAESSIGPYETANRAKPMIHSTAEMLSKSIDDPPATAATTRATAAALIVR